MEDIPDISGVGADFDKSITARIPIPAAPGLYVLAEAGIGGEIGINKFNIGSGAEVEVERDSRNYKAKLPISMGMGGELSLSGGVGAGVGQVGVAGLEGVGTLKGTAYGETSITGSAILTGNIDELKKKKRPKMSGGGLEIKGEMGLKAGLTGSIRLMLFGASYPIASTKAKEWTGAKIGFEGTIESGEPLTIKTVKETLKSKKNQNSNLRQRKIKNQKRKCYNQKLEILEKEV